VRFDVQLRGFAIERKDVIPAKAGTQAGCVPICRRVALVMLDSLGPGLRRDDGSADCDGAGQADAHE